MTMNEAKAALEAQTRVLRTMHNHKCLAYPHLDGAIVYDQNGPLYVGADQRVFYSLVRQGFLFRRGPAFCLTDKGRERAGSNPAPRHQKEERCW